MGKNFCSKCGEEITDSRSEKAERSMVMKMLKMIKVAGIHDTDEETKGFCYGCWKTALRSVMKPYAELLGKNAEDW